jgi:hypothetical protein
MVRCAARKRQATAHRRYLKDAAALLLSHDRQGSAGHVDYTVEISVNDRLESLRAQLLEWRNIAVARVIHHHIEMPEGIHGRLHGGIGRTLVCHIEGSGANPISVLGYHVFQAARIAGRCHETIARCKHSFRDVAAQSTCAAGNQPDFRHENLLPAPPEHYTGISSRHRLVLRNAFFLGAIFRACRKELSPCARNENLHPRGVGILDGR